MKVSISIVLDTRSKLKTGNYPVKIRLTHKGSSRYIPTIYSFVESDFEKIVTGKRLSAKESKVNMQFSKLKERAFLVVESMETYSFSEFKAIFLNEEKPTDLFVIIQDYIVKIDATQIAKRSHANALLKHLKKYTGKDSMKVKELTEFFVTSFIHSLITIGRGTAENPKPLKENSINAYISILRSLSLEMVKNKQLEKHPITSKHILKSTSKRSVLTLEEMGLFLAYKPNREEEFAFDMFKFSYLASGMNMADIFRLKWGEVTRDRFTFIRQKTKRSPVHITIFLTDELNSIIERQGEKGSSGDYVFPCLQDGLTFKEEKLRIFYKLRHINDFLGKMAAKLGIEKKVTTYDARHAYSNNMMSNEVPLAFISKQLGHATLTYTQVYLGEFPDHKAQEYSAHLIPQTKEDNN